MLLAVHPTNPDKIYAGGLDLWFRNAVPVKLAEIIALEIRKQLF